MSASLTVGETNSDMSPPSIAISFTRLDEINVYLSVGRQENGFDILGQVPVHRRELKFVLEVRYGAQAANNDRKIVLSCKIHGQSLVAPHLDIVQVGQRVFRHCDTFVESEHWPLASRDGCDRYDDLVKYSHRPAHQVFMTKRDRIERPRIHRGYWHLPPSTWLFTGLDQCISHLPGRFASCC